MNKMIVAELALLTASLSYFIAKKNSLKYPVAWFFAGLIFSVLGVAAVSIVSKYVNDKRKGFQK